MHIRRLHTCSALLKERPTNLKGKSHSSQLWLTRQLKDPYIEKAKKENYRCRSAFKLLEINERFGIFLIFLKILYFIGISLFIIF